MLEKIVKFLFASATFGVIFAMWYKSTTKMEDKCLIIT